MRRIICAVLGAAALFGASAAHAQFANKSIGVSLGYTKINADPTVDWALPLTLESSLYIESSFELVARFSFMLLTEKITSTQLVSIAPRLGVRYLFSEEQLRPYIGCDIAYLKIFRPEIPDGPKIAGDFVGLGPNGGVDYFVGDSVTIGGRAFFDLYIALNESPRTAYGLAAVVATYF
jgi:outer membrane protein